MTTNFYIIQNREKKYVCSNYPFGVHNFYFVHFFSKEIQVLSETVINNWAEAINERRECQTRLKMVYNSLHLISNILLDQIEENNEKTAILQSLMENSDSVKPNEFTVVQSQSEKELVAAKAFKSSLTQIENYCCKVTLNSKETITGAVAQASVNDSYKISLLEDQALGFDNISTRGPLIGATKSIFGYLMYYWRKCQLWNEIPKESKEHSK